MNLNQHARVVWKHRTVMAAGVLMGLVLAFLAAFSFPGLERRGTETWRGVSNILVTQKGFPEGRVTLPDQPAAGQDGSDPTGTITGGSTTGGDDNSQKFADPEPALEPRSPLLGDRPQRPGADQGPRRR